MDLTVFKYACISLIGVLISAISQVLLKKSAMKNYDSAIQEYVNLFVILAYAMFAGATLLSITAYQKIPLSMGAVMETTGYFYVTFFGITVFKEKVNIRRLLALGLIITGILIYAICG